MRSIVFHHTDSRPVRPTAAAVARYQTGPGAHLGFPSIAYTLYVEADGTVEQTADLEAVTWHCGTTGDTVIDGVSVKNWDSFAVCFAGPEPTYAQVEGMRQAALWLDAKAGRKLQRLGHKDVGPTECPGATWAQWKERV